MSKESFLATVGGVEWVNYRFITDSLKRANAFLNLPLLTSSREGSPGTFCDRGTCKSVIPSCRNDLDAAEMSIIEIEFLTPSKFPT